DLPGTEARVVGLQRAIRLSRSVLVLADAQRQVAIAEEVEQVEAAGILQQVAPAPVLKQEATTAVAEHVAVADHRYRRIRGRYRHFVVIRARGHDVAALHTDHAP